MVPTLVVRRQIVAAERPLRNETGWIEAEHGADGGAGERIGVLRLDNAGSGI